MSEYRSTYANSHAVIVGINTYTDPRFVPLGQAEADAQSLADLLSAPPYNFNVTLLLGAQATKSTILRALHQIRRSKPDDRLLVYFAGHGYTLADRNGSETGYLACADTVPDEDFTALELQDVIDLTRHTEAKHIGFIFDACFSGQALGLTRAPAVSADKYLQRRAYQVISAGAGDETVSDYRSMTGSLIDALKSEVLLDDGLITMSELGLHLRDVIASDSHHTQIPQFGHIRGSQGGDFVFYIDTHVRLPADLEESLRSPRANSRWGAVADLIELAHTESGELATLARERLAHIANEDADERVRNAAQSYFDEIAAGGDGTLTQTEIRQIRRAREITPSALGKPPAQPAPPGEDISDTLPYPAAAIRAEMAAEAAPDPLIAVSKHVAINVPASSLPLPLPVMLGIGGVVLVLIIGAIVLSLINGSRQPDDDNDNDNQQTQAAGSDNDNQATEAVDDGREPTSQSGRTVVTNDPASWYPDMDSIPAGMPLSFAGSTSGEWTAHYGELYAVEDACELPAYFSISANIALFDDEASANTYTRSQETLYGTSSDWSLESTDYGTDGFVALASYFDPTCPVAYTFRVHSLQFHQYNVWVNVEVRVNEDLVSDAQLQRDVAQIADKIVEAINQQAGD